MAKKRSYAVRLVITGKDLVSAVFGKVKKGAVDLAKAFAKPFVVLGKIGSAIGSIIEKIPGLAVLGYGIARAAGFMRDLAVGVGDLAGDLKDFSAQTGIGTQALQEVGFAAQKVGVPLEEFRASVQKMTATLGKGVGARQLGMLGRGAYTFARGLKAAQTPAQKFELVLSQMAAIEDPTKRAAFAMLFFGRSGVKLAAAGAEGAEGIRELRKEAHRLGLVMSDEDIDRADRFSDTYESLGMALEGGKRDFGVGLIEGLLPGLEEMLGLTKSNRREIGAFIRDLGRSIGRGVVDAANAIADAIKWIAANKAQVIDVMKWIGIGVAAIMGLGALGPVLMALAKNPLFTALIAAAAALKFLLDYTPKPPSQDQKRDARIAAFKSGGVLGGASATMGASTFGQPGLFGLAEGLINTGAYLGEGPGAVNEADVLARAGRENAWLAGLADSINIPGQAIAPQMSELKDQSVDVTIKIEDPGGLTSGTPQVKATPGIVAKARTSTGTRTMDHLKGGR